MTADLMPEYDGPERRKNPERREDFCKVHEHNLQTLTRIEKKLNKFDNDVVPTVHQNNGTVNTLKWIGAIVAGCAIFIAATVFDLSGYVTKHKYESAVGFNLIEENKQGVLRNTHSIQQVETRVLNLEQRKTTGP